MTDDIVAEILRSKKYKDIDPSIIRRICVESIKKHSQKKEVIKAIKNELYIIHASYLLKECHKKAFLLLSQITPDHDNLQLSDIVMQILQLHVSTRERVNDIREIYDFLSEYITSDSIVLDIGCGFSPFAFILLHEHPKSYIAYDINIETVNLLNAYFIRTNQALYKAKILDAVSETPVFEEIDMVFLFKLFPLLQQQKKRRGFHILAEMKFKKAIVSFSIKSISGKLKGMESFYSELFSDNLPANIKIIKKSTFSNEMFYVLEKSL